MIQVAIFAAQVKRILLPRTHRCFRCQASDIDVMFAADVDFERRRLG